MKFDHVLHAIYLTFILILSVGWYHQGYKMGQIDAKIQHNEEMEELRGKLNHVLDQSERLLETEKKIGETIDKTDKLLQDMIKKNNADPIRRIH